ncbi:MAG TPA: hypothetical protein EYP59_03505 [Thiotrichaceae bacterium]|nr:hypothetical protein [Thiotrichaceae bacterium]
MPNEQYLLRLCWQYLKRTVYDGGNYYDIERGISLGCPLSPLMAALYLQPLDEAFEGPSWFYARFMDDFVVIVPTRWKLNSALESVHVILNQHKLHEAAGKTFIGRSKAGFAFLGYHFTPESLTMGKVSLQRRDARIHRLYEQGASEQSVGEFISRWQRWAKAGLSGRLTSTEEFHNFPRQVDSSKLPLEAKFLALGIASVLSTAAFDSHATVYQHGTGYPSSGVWGFECLASLHLRASAKSPFIGLNKYQTYYLAFIETYLSFHFSYNNARSLSYDFLNARGSDSFIWLAERRAVENWNAKYGYEHLLVLTNHNKTFFGWTRLNLRISSWGQPYNNGYDFGVISYGVADEVPTLVNTAGLRTNICCPNTNLNCPPTGADALITLYEDKTFTFDANMFGFIDANGDSLDSIEITQPENADNLKLNGSDVHYYQSISAARINTLTFTPSKDANGTHYAHFNFKVNDGTDYSTEEYTMTLDVAPVNDAPSFIKGNNQKLETGINTEQIVTGWATNLNKGATNESTQTLHFFVSTITGNSIFTTHPAIDANGNLTYTPNGTPGIASVSVKIQDDGGTANGGVDESATQTFTITVDNEPYVKITETSGSTNGAEGGATDIFDVVLSAQPTNDVTITVSPDSQTIVDQGTLTFTNSNWNTAQTVLVTAVNDSTVENSHSCTINLSAASSDSNYNNASFVVEGSVSASLSVNVTKFPETKTVPDTTPSPDTSTVPKVTVPTPTPVITDPTPTTPTPPVVTEPVKPVEVNKIGFSDQAYQASENAGKVDITVNRQGTAGEVSVDLLSADDSAKASIHYRPIEQTLFWANGDDTEISVPFEIIDNSEVDGNKAVILSLGNVDNAEIQTDTAVLNIVDDDKPQVVEAKPEPNVPSPKVPVIIEEPPQVESAPIEDAAVVERDEFTLPTNTVVGSAPINPCNTSDELVGVCHAHAQNIRYQAIGEEDSLSNGILDHPLTSKGLVSNTTITEKGHLKGGQVSGVTQNEGLIEDVEFVGASISGKNEDGEITGTLGGQIKLASLVGGVVSDVRLAPDTQIEGSGKVGSKTNRDQLGGNLIGDSEKPAILKRLHIRDKSQVANVIIDQDVTIGEGITFTNVEFRTQVVRQVTLSGQITGTRFQNTYTRLENVTIRANSHLSNVVIGDKVTFEEGVTLDDSVTFEVHQQHKATKSLETLPKLKGLAALDKQGSRVSTWARLEGGARMGTDGSRTEGYQKKLTLKTKQPVDILGNVLTDVRHIGKRADIVVVAAHTPPGATSPNFYMLDNKRTPKPWDGTLSSLVPFQSISALAPVVSVPIWNNPLDIKGEVQVYLGYRLNEGLIIYSQEEVIEITLID